MRTLFTALLAILPALSQTPQVRFRNLDHPISAEFQVGDRFEILLIGQPHQPVSVRTTMASRTDWGPIIGTTDGTGQWSTAGRFEKSDFGDWTQVWTLGGKLAGAPLQFSVSAPCLPGKQGFSMSSGIHSSTVCETAEGQQTFSTPSDSDPFRTPDGRVIPGRSHQQTQELYQLGIAQHFIMYREPSRPGIAFHSSTGALGDETADRITKIIGVNALTTNEIENVLTLIRTAFAKPQTIAPLDRVPTRSLRLLQQLSTFTDQDSLQQQIAQTAIYLQNVSRDAN